MNEVTTMEDLEIWVLKSFADESSICHRPQEEEGGTTSSALGGLALATAPRETRTVSLRQSERKSCFRKEASKKERVNRQARERSVSPELGSVLHPLQEERSETAVRATC